MIEGNVSDNTAAIYIGGIDEDKNQVRVIRVNGTVSSDVKEETPIVVNGIVYEEPDELYGYINYHTISEKDLLQSVDITAWKINPNAEGRYVEVDDEDGNISQELSAAVEANIKYIIKVDNPELSSSSETGKAGDSIIIKVKEGYTVSNISGGTATLTKNADGSYSLVVPAGGGVEVSAVLKAIENLPSNNQNGSQNGAAPVVNPSKAVTEPGKNTVEVPLKNTAKKAAKATKTSAKSTSTTTSSKSAQTGWKDVGENRYYYNEDGTMQTGWAEIDGNKYYFDEDGIMQKGWVEIEGKWYYFDEDGIMQTGWLTLDDKTYYLDEDGVLVTGEQTIDGEDYEFDDDGVLTSKEAGK